MGYTVSFLYNETYGATHVNKITERLIGSGVSTAMVNGELYDTTDLNKITETVATEGVANNTLSCRVIKSDDTHFKILGGTAFFNNGLAVDVDSTGVILDILDGHNFVYFKYDEQNKTAIPVVSNSEPSSSDILLAEYEDGVLKDRRKKAVSKIEGFGTNAYYKTEIHIEDIDISSHPGVEFETKLIGSINFNDDPYKYGDTNEDANSKDYTHVLVRDDYGNMRAFGEWDGEKFIYHYAFTSNTYGFTEFGEGSRFVVYGQPSSVSWPHEYKAYLSFERTASGFDIYITTTEYTGTTAPYYINAIVVFC